MRDRLTNLLKVVISIGLMAWVFSRVHLADVGAQLVSVNLWFFLAALLLYIVAIIVNAAKWQVLLRAQQVSIPFFPVVQFQFIGAFFNNFLPANVGGDVMRGYWLARDTDRGADAAVSVIVDRIIGLMAYMSSAVLAAFLIVSLTGNTQLQGVEWVALVALLAMTAGLAVLLSRRLRALIALIFTWRWLKPLAPIWGRLSDAFNAYRFRTDALAKAFGIALVGIGCTALVNWCLSRSMGGLMPLSVILLFNPLIALVLMLPISIGGLGINQTAYPFFYGLAGVPPGHAVAVSLLMQLVMILGSLPGLFFWLLGRQKRSEGDGGRPAFD